MGRIKNIWIVGIVLFLLAGCGFTGGSGGQEEIKSYALVTKARGNSYNELLAEGFEEVISAAGENCIILSPEEATAEAQIESINALLGQSVESIVLAANDADALEPVLKEAMKQGIAVATVDSDVSPESRMLFVNQVSAAEIVRTLVETVYQIAGGSGQWAILSTSSQAANQNSWIDEIRMVLEDEKYRDLRLVDIVYGNDEADTSRAEADRLLAAYPGLKVICAPTVVGLLAAAQAVSADVSCAVRVTGLGLPSQMAEYVLGEDAVCPCLFLWDPVELGRLSAYVSLALANGEIHGASGEVLHAGEMGGFFCAGERGRRK